MDMTIKEAEQLRKWEERNRLLPIGCPGLGMIDIGTIEESNEYWKKEDGKMRNSESAQARGDNPRWLQLNTITVWPIDEKHDFVSYYDPFWKVMQRIKARKNWSEMLVQEVKEYDPNSRFEAYAYHRILGIIAFGCGAAYAKPDLPEVDRTKASDIYKGIKLMWASMEPQLYPKWPHTPESMWPHVWHLPDQPISEPEPELRARLKPESEADWRIQYAPIAVSYGPIFKGTSKPITDEYWIVEEFVINKDGKEEIRKHYRIENGLVKDWMQGFQRRRNNGRKRKNKSKDDPNLEWEERIAKAPPAKVVSIEGPSICTRFISKKEETVIELGYDTPMTKTTYEYERYLKFDNEEKLNEYVNGNHITLNKPRKEIFISRKVLSRDVYSEEANMYQHLMVPVQVTKRAPRVWKKTENNTLTYERSVEIEYANEYWASTLSERRHVIELPPLERKPVDITEEDEEEDVE